MKNLSLKLKNEVFDETESIIKQLNLPRNTYFNKAIEFYNRLQKRKSLRKQLEFESKYVMEDSMEVLKEFEKLEDERL